VRPWHDQTFESLGYQAQSGCTGWLHHSGRLHRPTWQLSDQTPDCWQNKTFPPSNAVGKGWKLVFCCADQVTGLQRTLTSRTSTSSGIPTHLSTKERINRAVPLSTGVWVARSNSSHDYHISIVNTENQLANSANLSAHTDSGLPGSP
jgi:hypothetical protein